MRKSINYRFFLILTQNDKKLCIVNKKMKCLCKNLEKLLLMSGILLKVKQYFCSHTFLEEKCKKTIKSSF